MLASLHPKAPRAKKRQTSLELRDRFCKAESRLSWTEKRQTRQSERQVPLKKKASRTCSNRGAGRGWTLKTGQRVDSPTWSLLSGQRTSSGVEHPQLGMCQSRDLDANKWALFSQNKCDNGNPQTPWRRCKWMPKTSSQPPPKSKSNPKGCFQKAIARAPAREEALGERARASQMGRPQSKPGQVPCKDMKTKGCIKKLSAPVSQVFCCGLDSH